jgi:hypothetical protein
MPPKGNTGRHDQGANVLHQLAVSSLRRYRLKALFRQILPQVSHWFENGANYDIIHLDRCSKSKYFVEEVNFSPPSLAWCVINEPLTTRPCEIPCWFLTQVERFFRPNPYYEQQMWPALMKEAGIGANDPILAVQWRSEKRAENLKLSGCVAQVIVAIQDLLQVGSQRPFLGRFALWLVCSGHSIHLSGCVQPALL